MQNDQSLKPLKSRRRILKYGLYSTLTAALAPALLLNGCGASSKRRKKTNIILVVIDTLRADHLSCYGYQRNTTPNIDAFAGQSIVWKNAISSAPWTLPSVASMLTSQYPSAMGMYDKITTIDANVPTLPEMLKQNNYTTHGIVSHALLSARLGFGRGFDHYDEESLFGHQGISSPLVTNKAASFLKQKHKNPFFLFLHYFDPHYDYLLHKKYNFYKSYKGTVKSGHPILDLWKIRHNLSKDDIKYLASLYDSEIAFTDEYIGVLLNELKKQGLYDDSVIIITSDHGEEFMERGWIGHTTTLHQELIRVPLIIKFPGHKARIIDSPVGLVDIVPTLCQYLGLKVPDSLDGKALLDFTLDKPKTRGPVFSETFNPQVHQPETVKPIAFRSIVLGDHKLIFDQITKAKQIYNLSEDPHERNNLSQQQSKENARLKALLASWIGYMNSKQVKGPAQDQTELFTPEQRKKLKALGYL